MGLTSAILTGFTGIQSNQFAVETIGNNVANVNTTAYKNSRALFETLMFQTQEDGTPPTAQTGGTNPVQFGYGSTLATTQRNFNQGGTERTGVQSDLAVDGAGFFILEEVDGTTVYTRDGAFSLDTTNTLVSSNGARVQGYGVGEDGTIDTGTVGSLVIPIGDEVSASATTMVPMLGNLNGIAALATAGSVSTSAPLLLADGTPAAAGTALTALTNNTGATLFNTGDVIALRDVEKGGVDVESTTFVVGTDVTTYGDLAAFIEGALGIDTSDSAAGSPGVTIGDGTVAPAGALVIASNVGDVNAINISGAAIRNETNGEQPFSFNTTEAIGAGAQTSFNVFDSLGTPSNVRVRMAPISRTDSGSSWVFRAEAEGADGGIVQVGSGTVDFDTNGQFVSSAGTELTVPRGETGAGTPLVFSLDFSGMTGLTSVGGDSSLSTGDQDGHEMGTLVGYAIDTDGVITGTFSNSETRVFGQIPLATFANNQGLVARSENVYTIGPNSGPATVVTPRTGSAGSVLSGELELSNVDLSRELIGLITASTGFSASSRTVRTADDMLQELMLLVR